MEHRVYLLCSS